MNHTRLNIVLTDDDDDDILLFQEALENLDYDNVHLTIYRNGRDFCERLDDTLVKPDLIFLDINMPIMNGRDCLSYIRTNADYSQVPIIMYSTALSPDDIEQCFNSGASLYITKPVHFMALQNMLADVLKKCEEGEIATTVNKDKFIYDYPQH